MIKINTLLGLLPKNEGYNIAGQASKAENVDFSDGYARPWCSPVALAESATSLSGHIYDGRVRFGDADVRYLNDETTGMVYTSTPCDCARLYKDWCTDDEPIALGLPVPDSPTLVSSVGTDDPDDHTDLTAVLIRYVNDQCPGCPTGPASVPSEKIKCKKEETIQVAIPELPTDKYQVTHIEIYRLATTWDASQGMHDAGTDGFVGNNIFGGFDTAVSSQFFRVGVYPVSISGTVVDVACDLPPGPALMCADNFPPPDGMCLAGETTRGSLVGFKDKTLLFSQRNMYHGWPQFGRMNFGDDIDVACVWNDTVFVLTCCGDLYIVLDNVTGAEVGECRSVNLVRKTRRTAGKKMLNHKQVVCDHTGFTWISDEGIMRASLDGNVVNITYPWFGYREWRNALPSQMKIGSYRGALMFSSPAYSGVLDMNARGEIITPDFTPNHSTLSICPDCWLTDCDGRLYFISCGVMYEFDAGATNMKMTWCSTVLRNYGPYSAGLVEFYDTTKNGSVGEPSIFTVSTYYKGQNQHDSIECTNSNCCFRFRRRKAHEITLQYYGCHPIRSMAAASSQSGLQQGLQQ